MQNVATRATGRHKASGRQGRPNRGPRFFQQPPPPADVLQRADQVIE